MKHGGNFMSNKVMEFYSKAVNDEQFVKSLEKFKTENGTEKTEAIKKVVLPYAKNLGYSFTEDELLHNLTEEELSQIAGGWFGSSLAAAATALAGLVGFGGSEAPPAQQPSQSTISQQSDDTMEQNIVGLLELTDNGDGTCTLDGISNRGISGTVIIPSEVDGKTITAINKCALQGCERINTLVIPASIQVIGDSAFNKCFGITSITFESGSKLHTIGSSAFSGCTRVKSLNIPNGVKHVAQNTFFNCVDLEIISIPKTVTSIDPSAFSYCKKLRFVYVPSHLRTQIEGNHVFPAECTVEYY